MWPAVPTTTCRVLAFGGCTVERPRERRDLSRKYRTAVQQEPVVSDASDHRRFGRTEGIVERPGRDLRGTDGDRRGRENHGRKRSAAYLRFVHDNARAEPCACRGC